MASESPDSGCIEIIAIGCAPYAAVRAAGHRLTVENVSDSFELTIASICKPVENTRLSGLYISSRSFFTQCKAEGFYCITYFLVRPHVMPEVEIPS